jgi:hypothetical protein
MRIFSLATWRIGDEAAGRAIGGRGRSWDRAWQHMVPDTYVFLNV